MSELVIAGVSRWFGNVVAVNDVTMTIGPGITGLLGPNGAGKSTLIHMMGGFLAPSSGAVTLDGETVWQNTDVYARIGIVPEREALYDGVTGRQFVLANARLQKLPDPVAATERALALVEMTDPADRGLSTYSKGMKQRVKMATALVHDPQVLLLDEPFNGMDPRQRMHLTQLLRTMAAEGRTIMFSSHILEEVEQIADRIEVLVSGRHAASGDFREIRRLMTERPHQFVIRCSDPRGLASALIADGSTSGIEIGAEGVTVLATDVNGFSRLLPRIARERGVRLVEVIPTDESLESVFAYLVARR